MLDVLFVITAALLFAAWYSTRTFSYWKVRNVVGKRPYPFVGTAYISFRERVNQAIAIREVYNEFPREKLIGGYLGAQPMLIVKDPELIKQVIVKDFHSFPDRGMAVDFKRNPLSQHLVFARGDTWRSLRHELTPTFTSGKMRNMFSLIVECGEEFQNHIEGLLKQGTTPEIKNLASKYTIDVIGSCAFGIKINSLKDDNTLFRTLGSKIFKPSLAKTLKQVLGRLFPSIHKLLGLKFLDKDVEKFFLNVVPSIMSSRGNTPSNRNDFIDLLMGLKSKGSIQSYSLKSEQSIDEIEITDDLLSAQAFVFFAAGFETSSATISFALHELAFHQDAQAKAAEEIESVLSKSEGRITYDALNDMKYLQMIIDETLRIYPPFGALSRMCMKPCKFTGTNVTIDKGVNVFIPVYALHHDPKYFPDPEKFIPERFDSTSKESMNPFVYLPFGEGPRVCIGLRFARLQIMVGLISVLYRYRVVPKTSTKRKIKLSPNTFVLYPADGIHLNFQTR